MDARFALLLACFFVSGFAALLYQTTWTRELPFVFGTSELAVAAVLAAFMGATLPLLRAHAAIAANRPVAAWGSLIRIAELPLTDERRKALAERVLEIAKGLPDAAAEDVRDQLKARPASPRPTAN